MLFKCFGCANHSWWIQISMHSISNFVLRQVWNLNDITRQNQSWQIIYCFIYFRCRSIDNISLSYRIKHSAWYMHSTSSNLHIRLWFWMQFSDEDLISEWNTKVVNSLDIPNRVSLPLFLQKGLKGLAVFPDRVFNTSHEYRRLRARRALTLLNNVPLRTRRVLSPQTLYSDSPLLVLIGTSLKCNNGLLALNWWWL